jgi:hypothetical protein
MSNEVQIVVSDKHVSRGGFGVARKEVKDLAKDVKDADNSSKGLGKTLGSLPSLLGGMGAKAGSALSDGFTKGVDGVTEALPKALSNPYVMGAAAAAGVFIGAAVGGAIVTGAGGALAGLGMTVAAKAPAVKGAVDRLKEDISAGMTEISKPFEKTWLDITNSARRGFNEIKPQLGAMFKDVAPEVSRFGDSLTTALTKFGPALGPIGSAFKSVLSDIGGRLPGVVEGLSDSFIDLSKSIEKNPQALGQMIEMMGNLAEMGVNEVTALNNIFSDFEEEAQMMSNFFDGNGYKTDAELGKNAKQGMEDLGTSAQTTTPAMRSMTEALAELSDEAADTETRAHGLRTAMDELTGQTPSYTEGLASAASAVTGLRDMFKDADDRAKGFGATLLDQSGAFDVTNENGRELYEGVRDVTSAFDDMAASVANGQGSREQFVADANRQRDALNAVWREAGLNEAQIASLNRTYGMTPQQIQTRLDLLGVSAAQGMINGFIQMNNGRTISIYTSVLGSGGLASAGRLATGGISSTAHAATGGARGGDTIMNEHGPERVRLPNGSTVVSAGTTRELDRRWAEGGGGGGVIEWGGGPTDDVGKAIWAWLQKNTRIRGKGLN